MYFELQRAESRWLVHSDHVTSFCCTHDVFFLFPLSIRRSRRLRYSLEWTCWWDDSSDFGCCVCVCVFGVHSAAGFLHRCRAHRSDRRRVCGEPDPEGDELQYAEPGARWSSFQPSGWVWTAPGSTSLLFQGFLSNPDCVLIGQKVKEDTHMRASGLLGCFFFPSALHETNTHKFSWSHTRPSFPTLTGVSTRMLPAGSLQLLCVCVCVLAARLIWICFSVCSDDGSRSRKRSPAGLLSRR